MGRYCLKTPAHSFTSCTRQGSYSPMWAMTAAAEPDVFVPLGQLRSDTSNCWVKPEVAQSGPSERHAERPNHPPSSQSAAHHQPPAPATFSQATGIPASQAPFPAWRVSSRKPMKVRTMGFWAPIPAPTSQRKQQQMP